MIFSIVLAVFLLDQLTKFFFTKILPLGSSFPVVKGVFHLTLVHNRGAAFGILKGQVPVFILTSLLAIILIFANFNKHRHKKLYSAALSLVLAGALGNLADRLFFGYVVDFLDFRVWPVFNVADCAITVGAILLGLAMLKEKDQKGCSLKSAG